MRRLVGLAAITVVAIAAVWLGSVLLVIGAGARPQLVQADAILVLGAAQYNGRPSPVYRARLDHALALWDQGFAPLLVFTGGIGIGDTLSEGEVGRRYAIAHGVPTEAILVEGRGMTSAQSITAAAGMLHDRSLSHALIVSDPFHMLRLDLLSRRAGIRPFRAPAPDSPISQSRSHRWRYILRESLVFPVVVVTGFQ
jgi:uncharacterized SAM-binding protein YcdF (DUF218 family)